MPATHPLQLTWLRYLRSVSLGTIAALLATIPVEAAEKIYLIYGPLNLSINIDSLYTFAKEGKINKDLAFYMNVGGVNEEEQAQFREALLQQAEIGPVLLSRFFHTEIGEDILNRFGKFINIQGGRNGKYALRGAMVQAAFDPEGLTLINILRKLPTNVQIDLEKSLGLSQAVELVIKGTEEFIAEVAELSAKEAAAENSVDFATLPDIHQPGELGVEKERWNLSDPSRNRQFYVDIYRPQRWRAGKTPVILLSHGLASRPEDFDKRAEHLASYGYVVALPQHPGSDTLQVENLINGYSREVFLVSEFIDRPQDISYVIDELERRNPTEFQGRLNLESVGVFGHSFGGYTALALAGATVDFDHLYYHCNRRFGALNTSLLLQCRALQLERKDYNFRDERVKVVLVNNPVNRSIFGPEGLSKIQIPVIIGAGSYDPATPFIFEQVPSFTELGSRYKYLVLIEGQAHVDFSQLDAGITDMLDSITDLTLPSPQLIDEYANTLILAFAEVHLLGNEDYRPYLQSSYITYFSQNKPFKAYLISNSSAEELEEKIEKFILENAVHEIFKLEEESDNP